MTTLDDLTNNIATLTTVDTDERAAIDALVTLVTTLKAGAGTLTAAQVDALDKANAALANIATADATATAAMQSQTVGAAAFPAPSIPDVAPAPVLAP